MKLKGRTKVSGGEDFNRNQDGHHCLVWKDMNGVQGSSRIPTCEIVEDASDKGINAYVFETLDQDDYRELHRVGPLTITPFGIEWRGTFLNWDNLTHACRLENKRWYGEVLKVWKKEGGAASIRTGPCTSTSSTATTRK